MKYKSPELELQFSRLLKEYTDSMGRVTYLQSKVSNWEQGVYDSLNQHLWTGEALLLWELCCDVTPGWKAYWAKAVDNILSKTQLIAGVISRHPYPYNLTENFDQISLDEYFGAMMYCKVVGNTYFPKDAILYGEKVSWCIIDQVPYLNLSPWKYAKTLAFWKTLFKVIKFAIKTRDFTGSNEMDKIIGENMGVDILTNYRMPKDQLFIYLTDNEQPGILMWIHFFISALHTLRLKSNETSGRILLFFKLLFLQKHFDTKVKWLTKYYKKQMTKKYGDFYLHECFKKYYEEQAHPFIQIAKHVFIDDNGLIQCQGEAYGTGVQRVADSSPKAQTLN